MAQIASSNNDTFDFWVYWSDGTNTKNPSSGITYSSDDTDVATVSQSRVVEGDLPGTAWIKGEGIFPDVLGFPQIQSSSDDAVVIKCTIGINNMTWQSNPNTELNPHTVAFVVDNDDCKSIDKIKVLLSPDTTDPDITGFDYDLEGNTHEFSFTPASLPQTKSDTRDLTASFATSVPQNESRTSKFTVRITECSGSSCDTSKVRFDVEQKATSNAAKFKKE